MKVLKLCNIDKTFYTELGEVEVLNNINFEIEEGEIVSIVGPSGSGKSTILNIISGLIQPENGSVEILVDYGYMFQKDQLFEWRTIWNNILLGLEIKKELNEKSISDIKDMLVKYDLIDFINNYPNELSGGMRQRIALIRTIATKPKILLLDEPFSALDYQTRINVSNDIYNIIKNEKLTAILVTHDISEAIALSDRIIVLSKRPAIIKSIHNINFDSSNELTPYQKRTSIEFNHYFDQIWSELNEDK